MFEIRITNTALNKLKDYDIVTRQNVVRNIESLKINPFFGGNIKKLHGKLSGSYRLRVGSIRVIYSIEKMNKIVWIEAIGGHEVYR